MHGNSGVRCARVHLRGGLILHPVHAGEAALPNQRIDAHRVGTHLLHCQGDITTGQWTSRADAF